MKTIIKDVQGLVASLFPSIHRVAAPSHRRLRLSLITLLLTLGLGQMWGYTTYYLKSDNTTWDKSDNRWGFNNDGTTTTYMAKNAKLKLWRTDWGENGWFGVGDTDGGNTLKAGDGGLQFIQYKQNVKYNGPSGMVCFHMDQTNNRNDAPWVWITRPTFYLKHNWGGGSWTWQTLTDNEDGTYKLTNTYGGTLLNYGDNSSDGGSGWGEITASVTGSPVSGDRCLFVFDASDKSATITKLCQITYDGNGKTSGTVPSAQSDKLYNTSVTLSSNDLTKTGYLHTGWNTKANGSGTHYNKGASITVTAANLTLYAEWTPITISDITLTPSSGTTESHTLRISFTTNVPTDNSYQYAIREFVSNGSSYGAGYQIGATYISSSNITTGEMNPSIFTSSGTYKTQILILKGGSVVYSSSDITFTIASATDPEWSMWNDNTKLGDFTNNGDGTYTLIVTIPATVYSLTHYNNDKGFVGTPGAETLTTERTLVENNGRLVWQDGAGSFCITIRKDGDTWKIKANKLQTTITLDANSGTDGTSPITASYGSALPSFTKHSRTNYTLTGYWTEASGGTKIINADGTLVANISGYTNGSSQWINTSGALTLHAQWTEKTYTVNVSCSNPAATSGAIAYNGGGLPVDGNIQVGNVTTVTLTASAAFNTGYKAGRWTLSGGVTLESGALTDLNIGIRATATGTAVYTYDEDLDTDWYLRGGSAFGGTTWEQDYQFMKKTGESTTSIAYYVVSISSTNNVGNNGNFQFKIRKGKTGNTLYGLTADGSSWWYYRSSGEQTMNTDGKNIELLADVAGDYEFKIDYSNPSLPKITVTYPPSLTWSAASVYSGNATINVSVENIVSGKSLKYELFAGATTTGSPLQTQTTQTTGTTASTTFTVNPAFAANEISKQYTVKITYNGTQTATYTSYVGRLWDINVSDRCDWGNMNIYMWDDAGAYPTAFPGTALTHNYGKWYTATLDGRYPNFKFDKQEGTESNNHTASITTYPSGRYYYLNNCQTLSEVVPAVPTVALIIVDDQISTAQISLTGNITNCGNDGKTADDMKEVGFYIGSTKYTAECTNGTYFYKTITGLTAGTNYDIKAYAQNIIGVGQTAVQRKSTRNDSPQSIKVRQSSGSTQLKIYAWTEIANNCAGGKLENAPFPGENMTRYGETQWWTFDLDNRYTHFIISQGTNETKSADMSNPGSASSLCYDFNTSTHALTTRECWEITGIDDSYDLYTSKTLSITPTVIDPAGGTWNYRWMRKTGSNTTVNGLTTTGEVNTVNAVIASTSAEDATFEFKVFTSTPSKTLATKTTTIHSHEPITITTKVPNNNGWSMLKYHYWGSMNGNSVAGAYKGGEYLMEADGYKYYSATFDEVYPLNFLAYDGTNDLLTYADDQKYRMTLNVENVTTTGCYLMGTTDAGSGSNAKKKSMTRGDYCPPTLYRVRVELPEGKDYGPATWRTLYSNAASVGNSISYFAAYDATLTLQKLESGNWTNLPVVLSKPANRAENGIYQASVASDNLSSITAYTGDLYVRSFLATGGWEDYLNPAKDNVMTKFTPESDYNYYWVKYTGEDENKVKTVKNVYVTVGNAINPQLTRIINDGDGKVNDTGNVKDMNIRYSYNSHNNILNIAAIGGAVTADPIFLTVYGKNGRIYKTSTINEENKTLPGSETNHGEKQKKFNDVSNWVYQADVYANVTNGTNVTAAVEARLPSGDYGGTGTVQTLTPEDGLEVLGDKTTTGVYKLRLLYDYKTNTITTGWLPTDGQNITNNTVIEGNMIINRKENNSVEQINITGDKTVSGLHKLYMALEVTKKSCFTDNIGEGYAGGKLVYYWFSLPYDCRVEDIMGAPGKYPDNWEIWEYDGEKRAKEGLLDDASFFKTVPFDGGILHANKGYCLGLYVLPGHFQNVTIDGEIISSIYIYFPSRVEGYTLKNSATKQLVVPEQYDATFFTRRPDREKYDRDWNLMGVPSYNDITSGISATDAGVKHTHEAASAPGFIYDYAYTEGTDGSSENNKYKYIPVNSNAAGFKYKAFFSYMMQYAGTITWSSNSIENIHAAPRKPVRTGEHQLTQATLNLQLLAKDEWLDNTFVSLLPKATDKVDHNIDLVKIWNSGSSQLCSLSEDVELAANCLSVDSQTVDLRVYIDNTRTYTFRLEEKVPDGLIALLEDTEAHTLTDLGSDAYTVDLMQGTYDSRFRLHLIVGSSDIGTDIDQLTNSMSYTLYGNELLLNALTEPVRAALYDPAGRLLYQGTVNPGNTINLPDQAGVYLLRLPTQTLRIVK